MAARVKHGHYDTIVKIVKGQFTGRIGYYDDDEMNDKGKPCAVVYFNSPLDVGTYELIPVAYLRHVTPAQNLRWRKKHFATNPIGDPIPIQRVASIQITLGVQPVLGEFWGLGIPPRLHTHPRERN